MSKRPHETASRRADSPSDLTGSRAKEASSALGSGAKHILSQQFAHHILRNRPTRRISSHVDVPCRANGQAVKNGVSCLQINGIRCPLNPDEKVH